MPSRPEWRGSSAARRLHSPQWTPPRGYRQRSTAAPGRSQFATIGCRNPHGDATLSSGTIPAVTPANPTAIVHRYLAATAPAAVDPGPLAFYAMLDQVRQVTPSVAAAIVQELIDQRSN